MTPEGLTKEVAGEMRTKAQRKSKRSTFGDREVRFNEDQEPGSQEEGEGKSSSYVKNKDKVVLSAL